MDTKAKRKNQRRLRLLTDERNRLFIECRDAFYAATKLSFEIFDEGKIFDEETARKDAVEYAFASIKTKVWHSR